MWSNQALNLLVDVRNYLLSNPDSFDPYFNYSDNIGTVIQCLLRVDRLQLRKTLHFCNTEFIQCNWEKIFDMYCNYDPYYNTLNYDLECILDELFQVFTLQQLKEINGATILDDEYQCFLSFLNGVIVNNLDYSVLV